MICFIKIHPCIPDIVAKMPSKVVNYHIWPHCDDPDLRLLTSIFNKFIFVPSCAEVVHLVKF